MSSTKDYFWCRDVTITTSAFFDEPGGLQSIHYGHLHIHKDDIIHFGSRDFDGLEAIVDNIQVRDTQLLL
jgi:hypothetical protein